MLELFALYEACVAASKKLDVDFMLSSTDTRDLRNFVLVFTDNREQFRVTAAIEGNECRVILDQNQPREWQRDVIREVLRFYQNDEPRRLTDARVPPPMELVKRSQQWLQA